MINTARSAEGTPPRILITFGELIPGAQRSDYLDAVARAGGEPMVFDVAGYAGGAGVPPHDGVIISGGADVDPQRYGEPPHRLTRPGRPERDEAELGLTRRALDERRPLLAICRGAQLLNVACGGSLHQHLEEREPRHDPRSPDGEPLESGWHGVEVAPGTHFARIVGAGPLRVNSRHHQAVTPERLAPGLVACGRTDHDGVTVIEALEASGHPFALGVQWHPERAEMVGDPALRAGSMALFEAFIAACTAVPGARAR